MKLKLTALLLTLGFYSISSQAFPPLPPLPAPPAPLPPLPAPPVPLPPPPPAPPTDAESWGNAGAIAYPAAGQLMFNRYGASPVVSLDERQKHFLRPSFGGLVDEAKIIYNAQAVDRWTFGDKTVNLGQIDAYAQTFCDRIYINDYYQPASESQLNTFHHELYHSKQCKELGGAQKFGWWYFYQYALGGQDYYKVQMEIDAYASQDDFAKKQRTFLENLQGTMLDRPCRISIALKSISSDKFIGATEAGGAGTEVNASNIGAWEILHLIKLNCTGTTPRFRDGDKVNLASDRGYYFVAEGNGGGDVNANREQPQEWETFTLDTSGGSLFNGATITLTSQSGLGLNVTGTSLKADGDPHQLYTQQFKVIYQ